MVGLVVVANHGHAGGRQVGRVGGGSVVLEGIIVGVVGQGGARVAYEGFGGIAEAPDEGPPGDVLGVQQVPHVFPRHGNGVAGGVIIVDRVNVDVEGAVHHL